MRIPSILFLEVNSNSSNVWANDEIFQERPAEPYQLSWKLYDQCQLLLNRVIYVPKSKYMLTSAQKMKFSIKDFLDFVY